MRTVLLALLLTACTTDDSDPSEPTCADIGCPDEPSGSADIWTRCETEQCYCLAPVAVACTNEVSQ